MISLMRESPAPTHFCVLATALLASLQRSTFNLLVNSSPSVRIYAPRYALHAMQASFIAILVIFASAVAPALSTPINLVARDPEPKYHPQENEGHCPMNGDYIAFSAGAQTVPYVGRPFPLERADSTATLSEIPSVILVSSSPGKPPSMKAPVFHHLITLTSFPPMLAIKPHIYASYSRSVLSSITQYGLSTFLELHQDIGSRYVGESGDHVYA
ncbi:hypothetical protein V8E53_009134 [Lactarius tabidus]